MYILQSPMRPVGISNVFEVEKVFSRFLSLLQSLSPQPLSGPGRPGYRPIISWLFSANLSGATQQRGPFPIPREPIFSEAVHFGLDVFSFKSLI